MQGIDGFLHVRPFLEDSDYRGFAMFFNPTNEIIKEMAEIPLYYTGLQTKATVILEGDWATKEEYKLDRDYSIEVPLRKFQFLYKKSSINYFSITQLHFCRYEGQILCLDVNSIKACEGLISTTYLSLKMFYMG